MGRDGKACHPEGGGGCRASGSDRPSHPAPVLPPKLGGLGGGGRWVAVTGSGLGHSLRRASPLRPGHGDNGADAVLNPPARCPPPARVKLRRWRRRQSLPQDLRTSSAPAAASAWQSQSPPPACSSRGTAVRGGTVPPPASSRASAWTIWLEPPLPRQRLEEGPATEGRGARKARGGDRPGRGGESGW